MPVAVVVADGDVAAGGDLGAVGVGVNVGVVAVDAVGGGEGASVAGASPGLGPSAS